MAQDDVASALMIFRITDLQERLDRFATGNDGQLAHALTSTVSSWIDGGIGSLCFFKLSR